MDEAASATDGGGSADPDGVPGTKLLTDKQSNCTTTATTTTTTSSLLLQLWDPLPGVALFALMNCFRPPPSARPANHRPDHHPPRARELLLLPFFAAVGILATATAVVSLFPSGGLGSREQVTAAAPGPAVVVADLTARESGLDFRYTGLIDPHNGDNGTDPAQTTTVECTGDFTLPVLDGVDLVSYFSLTEGDSPVYGSESYMAMFGAYRFYFSSIQNLQVFEEAPERYLPAWGGFCSYGVANETVWTGTTLGPFGDPSKWAIFADNRLHIFRSAVPLQKFQDDVSGNIKRGNDVWFRWFGEKVGPLNTACICADAICDDQ